MHSCNSQTKQGFAWRRDQPECACPEGKSLPLAKAYPGAKWESMGAKSARRAAKQSPLLITPFVGTADYALAGVASRADAGTALVLAQSRSVAISSAASHESGTVCAKASTSNCVVRGFFSEYAA